MTVLPIPGKTFKHFLRLKYSADPTSEASWASLVVTVDDSVNF